VTAAAGDSHAALMDRIYRRQRYIYDFTRKYYLFGRDRMIRQLALKPGARVVEVGCGTARNLIMIAGLYPKAKVYGLDASSQMLATATRSLAQAGLTGRVKLIEAYAEALSPALFGETEPFDAVVFSYSLSMIPDWKQALRSAAASLGSGGKIHIVDFGDLKGLGRPIERVLRAWLSLFHVAPREELLTTLEIASQRELVVLPGRYSFVLAASGEQVLEALERPVAEGSQALRKSESRPV
jgi:S-adenosylmethionine-diacylgycerolhomoserine-N-methlytransferase